MTAGGQREQQVANPFNNSKQKPSPYGQVLNANFASQGGTPLVGANQLQDIGNFSAP